MIACVTIKYLNRIRNISVFLLEHPLCKVDIAEPFASIDEINKMLCL